MIKIKKARIQDFGIVLEMINQLEGSDFDESSFKKIYRENLTNMYIIYRLAWKGKTAVAFISCHIQALLHHNSKVGEIQELFVVKEHRNKGIGRLLISNLKMILMKRKVNQLEAVSNRKRKSAHQFYLQNKFKWTSRKFVLQF